MFQLASFANLARLGGKWMPTACSSRSAPRRSASAKTNEGFIRPSRCRSAATCSKVASLHILFVHVISSVFAAKTSTPTTCIANTARDSAQRNLMLTLRGASSACTSLKSLCCGASRGSTSWSLETKKKPSSSSCPGLCRSQLVGLVLGCGAVLFNDSREEAYPGK